MLAEKFRIRLLRLSANAPQVILIEGGTESERLEAGLYWAQLANCKERGPQEGPCGKCLPCIQIAAYEFMDLLVFDGRISNKLDEEKPGPIRSLRMENMRYLKSLAGTAPHGSGRRIAIFQGMTQLREEALNSLLKTLEEPSLHTSFVLLTPQRQQILPTLVSRSFCLTLPWPGSQNSASVVPEWENALAEFLQTGKGFLDKIAAKGALDANGAEQIILTCQRALIRTLAKMQREPLDKILKPLLEQPEAALNLGNWLNEALIMLNGSVSPARIMEALATRMFCLVRQAPGKGHLSCPG